MKSTVIVVLLSISSTLLSSQTDSIPIGKVIYVQQTDVRGDIQKNGYSTLLFNSHYSVYIHNSAPTRDSSYVDPAYITPVSISGDQEGFPVYKLHAERQILSKIICRQAFKEHCVLRDTFGTIAWVIHPDHKRFGQYNCRRATGAFRGRAYEAWYSPDLPIPSGPFKLGGLPGLILEATSSDGKVKFLFGGLEISNNIPGIIRPPSGMDMNMNYSDYIEKELTFLKNLEKEVRATGTDMTITRDETIEIGIDK